MIEVFRLGYGFGPKQKWIAFPCRRRDPEPFMPHTMKIRGRCGFTGRTPFEALYRAKKHDTKEGLEE